MKLSMKLFPDQLGPVLRKSPRQAYRELSEADGWRRWRRPRGRFEAQG